MSNYQTEGNYIVAENESGELYIYISAKPEVPSSPHIIYDGRDHALLVKNPNQTFILDYINPDVRDKMRKSRQLIIVETIMENIKDAYFVDMQIVDKLPIDVKKEGLKTWEDVAIK